MQNKVVNGNTIHSTEEPSKSNPKSSRNTLKTKLSKFRFLSLALIVAVIALGAASFIFSKNDNKVAFANSAECMPDYVGPNAAGECVYDQPYNGPHYGALL
jgi:uncharacterized protein HemX